ncbi:cytochrome c biogenesis protein CcsA [Olleya sp. YSTF-M6]|uniref:Cytochrome c biogenesis protein CcsA n=1 Tax=Olleya sediminilitoris TaxID=2795739 RepID=A0ABS1WJW7_9FLAO|nr:cytochrome c biogenesis protein CcsA [Olleya sediminilitoris]MBL7559424.1 cytochrome c biogenesis protein CcsA [Olleya sediminilitoris]
MQNRIAKILFSTRLTSVLFIVFAVAMAAGTLLDRNMDTSPTPYTRNLIYNAWWFEAIMVLFMVNFIGNIFRFRLLRKEKWATLLLHLAFIFIILGAGITRYFGFEGMIAIREGETESGFLSQKTYITAYIDGDYKIDGVPQRLPVEEEVDFSGRMTNSFDYTASYNGTPVNFELTDFFIGAEEDVVPDDSGENYLKIVEARGNGPHNHFLKQGSVENIHNLLIALDKPTQGAVNITTTENGLMVESPFEGEYLQMATMSQGQLIKDSIQPLMLRSRYVIGDMQLVFPKPVVKGKFDVVKKASFLKQDDNAVVLNVSANGETKEIKLLGSQWSNNRFKQVTVGGLDIALKYGSKVLELPFEVKLNDFIAEKFPGTDSNYSSYESKVTVLDKEQGDFDFHIYMNNILDHRGYRFFQADFDKDLKGTILSVNHDYWGTWVTYLGYFLLYIGMMAILFANHTRFRDLQNGLEKIKNKKEKAATLLLLCFSLSAFAQHEQHTEDDGHDHETVAVTPNSRPTKAQIDSILKANVAPIKHAEKFGRLVIQDLDGRMMPIDTYASELVRKLTKHEGYEGLTSNQVFLSILESPMLWYNVPIIYLAPKKADSIRGIIGLDKSQKYATMLDFFDDNFQYKLDSYLEEASAVKAQTGIQKEFIEANQRINLLSNAIEGRSLKIFPVPDDENNKWISPFEYKNEGFNQKIQDTTYGSFIGSGFDWYLLTLNEAKKTGDFTKAEKLLDAFKVSQKKVGANVMLSDDKIDTEILYNKYDVFKKLFSWYMYAGTLLFVLLLWQIFKSNNKWLNTSIVIFKFVILGLFVLHTLGLIARWYISGHAPWSDAYESMIYVAWATMFFGLAFGRKSDLTLASTAFVTAMILMIAHWNWMDPAIANLQPVLNSYWLMIHVAVIVASYGPFTLGMILGIVSLVLILLTNKNNKAKMDLNIKELTIINEMSLTVGLVMLTIGNFLGGQWANESWGRYWGWDPKETWALISIMLYAFVIHMRLVPGLRGRWFFNLMSIITFGSILMTYFGVNFYLSGLHSYASGDQIVSFKFIGIALVIIAILAVFSYRKYAKFYKK